METILLPAHHPDAIKQAISTLQAGGLVVFPTDTVYGLGALIDQPKMIAALYGVKKRERDKAIPILLGDPADLGLVAVQISETARKLAGIFWPGPLTLVLHKNAAVPEILSPLPTIGVRMPDHPIALALLRQSGPLAVTSANLSGEKSPVTAQEVMAQLDGRIPLVLDGGRTPGGNPSTVVDCSGIELQILRPGPLTLEDLTSALP